MFSCVEVEGHRNYVLTRVLHKEENSHNDWHAISLSLRKGSPRATHLDLRMISPSRGPAIDDEMSEE